MYLPTDYLKELRQFTNFNIEYNLSVKKYKIKDLWVDEIDVDTYDLELQSLKRLLIEVLKNCDDKPSFLSKVIAEINVVCDWYEKNHLHSFNSFNQLQRKICTVEDDSIYDVEERYTVNDIVEDSYVGSIFDPLLYYLKIYEVQTNKYQNIDDFEKVKLMHKLSIFVDGLKKLKEYALLLEENITAFKVIDFDISNEDSSIQNSNLRCTVNYDKITTANLFYIFLTSGIFYFDKKDTHKNSRLMKEFINENFNYTNASLASVKIDKIEKEFSYVTSGGEHKKRQQEIVQKMIDELEVLKAKF